MIWVILILTLIFVVTLVLCLNFLRVRKLFRQGNVIVTGLRGSGKDMLFANVIARSKVPYISNIDYKVKPAYIPLKLNSLDIPDKFTNFIDGDIIPYEYPYPERSDIYVSDAGVYFPSQYQGLLCKEYEGVPYFQALSRHLGDCNFHCNVQNLNRLWDKIREQSDTYIRCLKCRVVGKFVIQSVIVYDNYDSCLHRVEPYKPIKARGLNSRNRTDYNVANETMLRNFKQTYGSVKRYTIVYRNKSKYDTRLFKTLLKGGVSLE